MPDLASFWGAMETPLVNLAHFRLSWKYYYNMKEISYFSKQVLKSLGLEKTSISIVFSFKLSAFDQKWMWPHLEFS